MTSIRLILTGAVAKAEVTGVITAGMEGIPVVIECDKQWEGLTKSLVCRSDAGVKTVLDIGTQTTVAPEVLQWMKNASNELFLGVEGRDLDGVIVFPSTMAYCGRIAPGADPGMDNAVKNAEPVWSRVLKTVKELENLEDRWKNDLAVIINEVVKQEQITGGYYTPVVTHTNEGVMQFRFVPSQEEMPVIPDVTVALPEGKEGARGLQGEQGHTPVRGKDYWTEVDKQEINNESHTFIVEELTKRGQLRPEFANSIEECTDTTKLYVLPDGYIYGYIKTEQTIKQYTNLLRKATDISGSPYNGGLGYKNGYRVSSNNIEKIAAGYDCTGYFPISNNTVVRIKNIERLTDSNRLCTIVLLNAENKVTRILYGDEYDPNGNGVYTIDLTQVGYGAVRFRFTAIGINAETIVTAGEEIVETVVTGYQWANTGRAFIPADYEERIVDIKTIAEKNKEDIRKLKSELAGTNNNPLEYMRNWDAPIYDAHIPVFQLSKEKQAIENVDCTPKAIYAKYDTLMAKYPRYITKTDLGICSDGVTHVYRYDFRDPEPLHQMGQIWSETKMKAVVISGIHYEWAGIYGLYYALEEIVENVNLVDFRRNTHLIVIPVANPYCTYAENYEETIGVLNANGVQIHRNFEVGFIYPGETGYEDQGSRNHGGKVPLSEVETQYIDTVLKENTDAALLLSCHNFDADTQFGIGFIWPSAATKYMCNMGFRIIDKMSNVWIRKYGDTLKRGVAEYKTENLQDGETRFGFAHVSNTNGTETRQATKYGIQGVNVEICNRFYVHGTKTEPEKALSTFTLSRGAEVYVNFLMTALGSFDHKDKNEYQKV